MTEKYLTKTGRLFNSNSVICSRGAGIIKALDFLSKPLLIASLLFLLLGGSADVNAQSDGDLRLRRLDATGTVVTGTAACSGEGRTEIFNEPDNDGNGTWRGICDDGLLSHDVSKEEAAVICRQLGCSGGEITHDVSYDSDVSANFPDMVIDNLLCTGSEKRVFDCEHGGRDKHNCYNGEIFTVACESGASSTAKGLLGITGTLEVGETLTADVSDIEDDDGLPATSTFSYQWVRVNTRLNADDNETEISGGTSSTYVLADADFGKSIKLELSFTDEATPTGNKEEVRSRVMGPVTVSAADAANYDGRIRLAAGVNELEGRVEIFDGKTDDGDGTGWESVCANSGWGSEEAGVVCSQLNFSGNTPSPTLHSSGISAPRTFLLDEVVCDGGEDELLDCEHGTRGVHDCSSWRPEYAKVRCSN